MKNKEEKRDYKILSVEDKFKMLAMNFKISDDVRKIDLSKVHYSDIKFTYNINLDFKVIYELGWFELDVIDLSLFQVIARILHFTQQAPKVVEGTTGTWFKLTEKRVMLECPFIPLSSEVAIRKRIKKLEDRNLIEACPKNSFHRLKYFRLGSNAELLSGSTQKGDKIYDTDKF